MSPFFLTERFLGFFFNVYFLYFSFFFFFFFCLSQVLAAARRIFMWHAGFSPAVAGGLQSAWAL